MSNTGFRSIEVQINNYLDANLMVRGAAATESWIDGEQACAGQEIVGDQIVVFGVKTNDARSDASLTVTLGGPGSVTIVATNTSSGKSHVSFTNVSPEINPTQHPNEGSGNHARFRVDLNPVSG